MDAVIREVQGWLSYLDRPSVLLQLLPVAVLLAGLLQLRRPAPGKRWRRLAQLPLAPALLAGEGLILLCLTVLRQCSGLVLLLAQITLAWTILRQIETHLLNRWLAPATLQILVSRLLRPLFLIGVLLVCLDALGSLEDLANASLGVWFGSRITAGNLFQVLLVLYLLLVGLELPSAWVSRLVRRGLGIGEGSRRALEQILRYVFFSLGVVWGLNRLGINQTGLLAVAGGLSVGLGFGIKEVFSNIVSGLWLLVEGSVRPGELLLHQGELCEVRKLGPRATTLWRGSDNAELVVPNQTFFTTATTSFTRSDRTRRCGMTLAVDRHCPPPQVIALLQEIVTAHPEVLADPAPSTRLNEFGPETYTYSLGFSISDPQRSGSVSGALRLAIHQRFFELGIKPPS